MLFLYYPWDTVQFLCQQNKHCYYFNFGNKKKIKIKYWNRFSFIIRCVREIFFLISLMSFDVMLLSNLVYVEKHTDKVFKIINWRSIL